MQYNIDEFKVNDNKLYINGWVHKNNYKIIIQNGEEEKELKDRVPRFDISMKFHEKVDDNEYGFKGEISFKNKISIVKVFLKYDDEMELIQTIDVRKSIMYLKKIKKFGGKCKRGIKFLWKEYHFLVPPQLLGKYFKMLFKGKPDIVLYNPAINSEYNEWLSKVKSKSVVEKENNKITMFNLKNDTLSKIKTKYVCVKDENISLSNDFYDAVKESIEKDYDLIYYDNDIKKNNKYSNPNFKPDFSPDTLLGLNYIGNCFIIKTSVLKSILKENKDLNEYDILLNCINKNISICHIAKILYHDSEGIKNGKKEVMRYLKDNKLNAKVHDNPDKITTTVEYIPSGKNLVSIIIPTKDHADILEKCLESVYTKTTYKKYEVIVIDNNSCEKETFDLLKKYEKKYSNFRYKRIECEFNYSYLNNEAVKMSDGDYVLLLNNDIEVITPEWLERMLGYAEQKHVGTVGAKLIFPDETIQHAGIIMGKGGLAGHAHYEKPRDYISNQYELLVPYNYSACTAACLLISKKKYKEVGGLEEKLKVAFNDVDFNLKVLDKGYYNVFLPNVELYHYESKSRGLDTSVEKQKRFVQEWSYIVDKWQKYIDHDRFYNDNFYKHEEYKLK